MCHRLVHLAGDGRGEAQLASLCQSRTRSLTLRLIMKVYVCTWIANEFGGLSPPNSWWCFFFRVWDPCLAIYEYKTASREELYTSIGNAVAHVVPLFCLFAFRLVQSRHRGRRNSQFERESLHGGAGCNLVRSACWPSCMFSFRSFFSTCLREVVSVLWVFCCYLLCLIPMMPLLSAAGNVRRLSF